MNPQTAGGPWPGRPSGGLPPGPAPGAFGHALRYALAAAMQATPGLLTRPTPCRGWDLGMLLAHAGESLTALAEGFDHGRIGLRPATGPAGTDPGLQFRRRARALLAAGAGAGPPEHVVTVGGCPLAGEALALAGALELAVHGWDISRACGGREPIPPALAAWLLGVAPMLISAADRQSLFAAPVLPAPGASPSDRLAAFLGRSAS